jgi:circadian clock protein KaiC
LFSKSSFVNRPKHHAIKNFLTNHDCTVLLLDDNTAEDGNQHVHSLAHGVISLERTTPGYGTHRRQLQVVKLRGVDFIGGNHDFIIKKGGVELFPRLIASDHLKNFKPSIISSGIKELDDLFKGGLTTGTSSLFLGPAGSGKSTLAIKFAHETANRGSKVSIYAFDETVTILGHRAKALGMDIEKHLASGKIKICQIDPAELSPGELTNRIKQDVISNQVEMIIIDSLNGYLNAMPDERFLLLQLHELFTFLNQQGTTTILVAAQAGILGHMQTPADLTYLADTVLLFRFFETEGELKQALAVIKKRSGNHERSIREFKIDSGGIRVGASLKEFHGVLTGTPQYHGEASTILHTREES